MAAVANYTNGNFITRNPTNIAWNSVQLGQRSPGNLQQNPIWGQTGAQTTPENPYLPALWWVGLVIALVAIRFLSSKYVQ